MIVAAGSEPSYFGRSDWPRRAPPLKTIEDATRIRARIFAAFEAAERESDSERRRELMTFVIVGGGPTGVELAGALAEIGLHTLRRDFRTIDSTEARVILIEGSDRVLPTYPPALSARAAEQLVKLGVEVRCGSEATSIDGAGVTVGGERIAARTVLWAAGVRASPLARSLGAPLDRGGSSRRPAGGASVDRHDPSTDRGPAGAAGDGPGHRRRDPGRGAGRPLLGGGRGGGGARGAHAAPRKDVDAVAGRGAVAPDRAALIWSACAWSFHAGVLALMAIAFPYPLSGCAFLAFFPVERALPQLQRWRQRLTALGRSRASAPSDA